MANLQGFFIGISRRVEQDSGACNGAFDTGVTNDVKSSSKGFGSQNRKRTYKEPDLERQGLSGA